MSSFAQVLGIAPGDVAAFVGSGGKTSLLFLAARELAGDHAVLCTTTTHMAEEELAGLDVIRPVHAQPLARCRESWNRGRPAMLVGERDGEGRVQGPAPDLLAAAASLAHVILVEADGSRRKPLKLPRPGEPVLPPGLTRVVAVFGGTGLTVPVSEKTVFNLSAAAKAGVLTPGARPTPDDFAALVEAAGLRELARRVPVRVVLNQSDALAGGESFLRRAYRPWIDGLALACAREGKARTVDNRSDRVAAVILAAGLSTRYPGSKLTARLLGRTVLDRTLEATETPGFCSRFLVVGHDAAGVLSSLPEERLAGVTVVRNAAFSEGMASSLRAGLDAVRQDHEAAALVPGDMPHLTRALADRVLAAYRASAAVLCAPRVGERTGHPVVFRQDLFEDLDGLAGDVGGRAVVRRNLDRALLVEADPATQRDVDEPDDLKP